MNEKDRKLDRYRKLLSVGKIITSEMSLEALFPLVIEHTNDIMDTEASSIFLFDKQSNELWSLVSTDVGRNEIRIPATEGIAGWVFQNRVPALVNHTPDDPRFSASVDTKTGFTTRNVLCVPLVDRHKECVGTIQALNKKTAGFTLPDQEILGCLADYATVALENSMLCQELRAMNKAKERAINHLSHELKTPLALISATLGTISHKLDRGKTGGLENLIGIAQRNLNRLLRLQEEIDNIVNDRPMERQTKVLHLVEDALHFVERLHGVSHGGARTALRLVSDYIGSIYRNYEEPPELFQAGDFLKAILSEARSATASRELTITEDFPEAVITAHRHALRKVCAGLLRNAIENTPDEGRIEVAAKVEPGYLVISFRDFGIGITEENRKLIFSGFFHTQDTNLYSTKVPYDFNAGGSGADLLRAAVFSERYGFLIDFESVRCAHIPGDSDECPGRISLCPASRGTRSCRDSGTVFFLRVPFKEN